MACKWSVFHRPHRILLTIPLRSWYHQPAKKPAIGWPSVLERKKEKHISANDFRVNRGIRVAEVRLIGPDGDNIGVVPIEKALEIAKGYEQEPGRGIALVIIYAALGDVEKTLYWSEQARANKLPWSMGLFSYFTATRSLLGDPRIRAEAEKYPAPLVPYPKDQKQ